MDRVPFQDCWHRVKRAETHREAFGREWHAFLEDDPYDTTLQVQDNGTGAIWVSPSRPFPAVMALELGEMLYQLRAVLDSCVYDAAIEEAGGQEPPPDEDKLEFPIREAPAQFEKAAWHIAPLREEIRRFIESIQPYNVDEVDPDVSYVNESLGMLNDWARKDRHRRLHLVGSWVVSTNPQVRAPEGVTVLWKSLGEGTGRGFLEDQSKIASFVLFGWEPGMDVEANPDIYIDVAINEPPPPRDEEDTLSWRLSLMFEAVKGTIRAFERMYKI